MSVGDEWMKLKQRVEEAERERDIALKLRDECRKNAVNDFARWSNEKAARERAETEREETLRMWREYKAAKDADVASTDAARERAEADNAVLLETVREIVDRLGETEPRLPGLVHDEDCQSLDENWADECDCSWAEWKRATLVRDHPGAALLEYVKALETDSSTGLEAFHGVRCTMAGGPHPSSPAECSDARCAAWAARLKERKP
jgi:hypothetical protein